MGPRIGQPFDTPCPTTMWPGTDQRSTGLGQRALVGVAVHAQSQHRIEARPCAASNTGDISGENEADNRVPNDHGTTEPPALSAWRVNSPECTGDRREEDPPDRR